MKLEEGDKCPTYKCIGELVFKEVENCSCHINPPCSACVDNPLVCLDCNFEEEK